jgi:hypothetical protein
MPFANVLTITRRRESLLAIDNPMLSRAGLWFALGAFLLIAACFPPILLSLLLITTFDLYVGPVSLVRRFVPANPIRGSHFRQSERGPPRF